MLTSKPEDKFKGLSLGGGTRHLLKSVLEGWDVQKNLKNVYCLATGKYWSFMRVFLKGKAEIGWNKDLCMSQKTWRKTSVCTLMALVGLPALC